MKIHKQQDGIAHLGIILLILLVLSAIGFAGWRVYETGKNAKEAEKTKVVVTKENPNGEITIQLPDAAKVPDGYILYENKDQGMRFAYPKEYGSFRITQTYAGRSISEFANVPQFAGLKSNTISEEPATDYASGIKGSFQILTYKSSDAEISSGKYRPNIKLSNGKWIVVDSDVSEQKVGDEYKALDGKPAVAQKRGKLSVYDFGTGDEGCSTNRLVFVAATYLHVIVFPTFCDGTYGTDGNETEPNDAKPYNQLNENVLNTLSSID